MLSKKPGILCGRQAKSSVPHADNKSLDPNVALTKRVGAKGSFMFATFGYGYALHRYGAG
jgi:hypothetical protein